jgi:hypothetical protein
MQLDSDCDGLDMVGNTRKLSNQPKWSHLKIHSESIGVIKISQSSDSDLVLRHRLLSRWAVFHVGAH